MQASPDPSLSNLRDIAVRSWDIFAALGESDPSFAEAITEFQADEREHRDAAIEAGAQDAFGYPILYAAIRAGCRAAIESGICDGRMRTRCPIGFRPGITSSAKP